MTIPLPVRSCIVTYLGEGRGLHYSLGVSAGERLIAQPIGTSLDLFTADQLRAYGEAVRAEERERLLAVAAARTGHEAKAAAHHAGTWYEAYAHHLAAHKAMCDLIDAVWQDAAAIRSASPPQCTAPPSEPQ